MFRKESARRSVRRTAVPVVTRSVFDRGGAVVSPSDMNKYPVEVGASLEWLRRKR